MYGERPEESPKAIAISIDTNDTHSSAAALIGPIAFTGPYRFDVGMGKSAPAGPRYNRSRRAAGDDISCCQSS